MGNFAENLSLGKRVLPPWKCSQCVIIEKYGRYILTYKYCWRTCNTTGEDKVHRDGWYLRRLKSWLAKQLVKIFNLRFFKLYV